MTWLEFMYHGKAWFGSYIPVVHRTKWKIACLIWTLSRLQFISRKWSVCGIKDFLVHLSCLVPRRRSLFECGAHWVVGSFSAEPVELWDCSRETGRRLADLVRFLGKTIRFLVKRYNRPFTITICCENLMWRYVVCFTFITRIVTAIVSLDST